MISDSAELVWRILSGIPVEVFDEDNYSVWSNDLWELTQPRVDGDYAGQRTIGSANIVSAYNLLHIQLLRDATEQPTESLAIFKTVLEELQSNNLVRKRPDRLRATFKTV